VLWGDLRQGLPGQEFCVAGPDNVLLLCDIVRHLVLGNVVTDAVFRSVCDDLGPSRSRQAGKIGDQEEPSMTPIVVEPFDICRPIDVANVIAKDARQKANVLTATFHAIGGGVRRTVLPERIVIAVNRLVNDHE
jgi:hypothetical protein